MSEFNILSSFPLIMWECRRKNRGSFFRHVTTRVRTYAKKVLPRRGESKADTKQIQILYASLSSFHLHILRTHILPPFSLRLM